MKNLLPLLPPYAGADLVLRASSIKEQARLPFLPQGSKEKTQAAICDWHVRPFHALHSQCTWRVFTKRPFARRSTEIIGLSHMPGLGRRLLLIHFHAANRIFGHAFSYSYPCSWFLLQLWLGRNPWLLRGRWQSKRPLLLLLPSSYRHWIKERALAGKTRSHHHQILIQVRLP